MFESFSMKFTRASCFSFTLLIFIYGLGLSPSFAAGPDSREYVLKAGYIYHFTKFIKWSNKAKFEIENKGLRFCLVGEDPFESILNKFSKKLKRRNKKLLIVPKVSVEEMPQCHILYVSPSVKSNVDQILQRVKEHPVLVIGDTPGFAQKGVGINFFLQKNKIRFEINREALRRAGLVVSSELLNLGRIIPGRKMR